MNPKKIPIRVQVDTLSERIDRVEAVAYTALDRTGALRKDLTALQEDLADVRAQAKAEKESVMTDLEIADQGENPMTTETTDETVLWQLQTKS